MKSKSREGAGPFQWTPVRGPAGNYPSAELKLMIREMGRDDPANTNSTSPYFRYFPLSEQRDEVNCSVY